MREGMKQRGFASVGSPTQGYLGHALATHSDTVALDGVRACMGCFDLLLHPFAQISIGAIAVARQFVEDGSQLAGTLRALFANETTFYKLHLGAVRHRHSITPENDRWKMSV